MLIPSDHNIKALRNYYSNLKVDLTINLKFRYIKVYTYDLKNLEFNWLSLGRFFNKRRILNSQLPSYLLSLIEKKLIPLRVFQSATTWLSPAEVFIKNQGSRLLESGIFPFESDENLEKSILAARQLSQILTGYNIIYSGNKSIHIWWHNLNFEDKTTLTQEQIYSHKFMREQEERRLRKIVFADLQSQIDYPLDRRNAVDTRRVVPVIGSVNGLTGRVVTKISKEMLFKTTPTELRQRCRLPDWV